MLLILQDVNPASVVDIVSNGEAMLSVANFTAVAYATLSLLYFSFSFPCIPHFPQPHSYFELTCREATAMINQLYSVDNVIRLGNSKEQRKYGDRMIK